MSPLRSLRSLFRRRALERDLDDELRFHLEMQTEENVRAGMSAEEARRQAVLLFGGVEGHREAAREARGTRALEDLARELRYALRTLGKSRGFSLVAVLTLATGIGAVTALFALVNSILIQPLPYPEADRLVSVEHAAPGLGMARTGLSSGTFYHYRARAAGFEELAVYEEGELNLSGGEAQAERVAVTYAGPDLFRVLGVTPLLGRLFTEEDGRPGFMDTRWTVPVLLSHHLWQRRYGGDVGMIGRIIMLNGRARVVVGVLPAGFAFPRPETQLWVLNMPPVVTANFAARTHYRAVARLRPGVTSEEAEAELGRVLPLIEGVYPDATAERLAEVRLTPIVRSLKSEVVGDVGAALWVLLAGMGLLLAVACANVANLFLLRAEHRMHEAAVRTALGARFADLVRFHLSESILLSLSGAALGLLWAGWGLALLVALAPVQLPRLQEVRIDGWVLAFTAAVTTLSALLFGVLSARRQSRSVTRAPNLGAGGSTSAAETRDRRRLRDVLVAAQLALALVLLVAAVLMLQSLHRLTRVDPGFDARDVLTVQVGLPSSMAPDYKRIVDALLERVRVLPGVTGAAAVSALPLGAGAADAYPLRVPGRARPGKAEPPVSMKFITPGYFGVMRTPVRSGAGLEAGERSDAPHPVVVSAALARRLYPGQEAVGKPVRRLESSGEEVVYAAPGGGTTPQADYTIAGVVADVRELSLRIGADEVLYIPALDPPVEQGFVPTQLSLVVRAAVPPLTLAPELRRIVNEFDPSLTLTPARTMESIVAGSTAREAFLTVLLLVAAGAALFLGIIGVYGVVAYAVRRRSREIGIRMALGARGGQVAALVLRESISTVLLGAALGLSAALLATRVLRSLLYEVSPNDPVTLSAVTLLLVGVALLAALIPARRATRVEAMVSLRTE